MTNIKLRPKKQRNTKALSLSGLFADKKKRYFFMILFMLPFLIAIGIFATIAYREAKSILSLASGGPVEYKDENVIGSTYILRENATDLQKEYFAQLKSAIEEEEFDEQKIAELVAKNYIADFYTWTNKQGQYDIGGMYYIYDGEFTNGDHYRDNVYLLARDGFYKYISNYITDYGAENLLEVTDVEIVKYTKEPQQYMINEHVENRQDEEGEWYDYREDHYFDAYNLQCRWTYNPETALPLSNFGNSINLLIINKDGTFVIVESSENPIEIKERKNEEESESETDSEESETETSESSNG